MTDDLKMARFWMVWNPHGRAPTHRHDMDATARDYAEGAMDYLRAIAE